MIVKIFKYCYENAFIRSANFTGSNLHEAIVIMIMWKLLTVKPQLLITDHVTYAVIVTK